MLRNLFAVLLVNAFLAWLYKRASAVPAETFGHTTVFRFTPIARTIVLLGAFMGPSILVLGFMDKQWIYAIIGIPFTALSLAGWPNVLVADENGITSIQFLRRTRTFRWSELQSARYNTANQLTELVSTSGTKIFHTGLHCDPERLHELVTKYSKVKVRQVEPTLTGNREVS
jgi:hypothetical protein